MTSQLRTAVATAPRPLTTALPQAMKAVTHGTFGPPDVLRLGELAVPEPGPGQVLVRIRAAAVNPWDWHFMRGLPYIARLNGAGLRRPKHPVLGGDIAGEVVATGTGTTRFAVGDRVYGFIEFGGFAEYAVAPESLLAAMPANLTFEQAAAVPLAATTALQGLRDVGRIQAGDRVLVIGASGGVGHVRRPAREAVRRPRDRPSPAAATPRSSVRSAPTTSSTTPARTSPPATTATTSSFSSRAPRRRPRWRASSRRGAAW